MIHFPLLLLTNGDANIHFFFELKSQKSENLIEPFRDKRDYPAEETVVSDTSRNVGDSPHYVGIDDHAAVLHGERVPAHPCGRLHAPEE